MLSRTDRQKLCIKKWIEAKGCATIEACTGFGKSFTAIMIIKKILKVKPNSKILISVPTEVLKNQWKDLLSKMGIITCAVEIINTIVRSTWEVDLLIVDEIHLTPTSTYGEIFKCVDYVYFLGLTGTLERLDGKEEIIKQYAPVCDTITLVEAEKNGWVSKIKEYAVLLDVDLTDYKELDRKFNSYFAFFNWDFDVGMKCSTDWKFRNSYAKQLGITNKEVMGIAMDWMRMMRKRKNFIYSHPKKLEICKKILNARKDKKCITFSATIKDAEALKVGLVLHSKQSKKQNKDVLNKFNASKTGVLCSSKAVDCGVDIKGLSVGIIMSIDSSKIRKTQRIGRVIRFEEGKVAEMFTLIIKGTQEWKWFQNSNTSNTIVINEEQLEKVLKGEEIITRERAVFAENKYRF